MKSVANNAASDIAMTFPRLLVYGDKYIVLVTGESARERPGRYELPRYIGIMLGLADETAESSEIGKYSDNWGNFSEGNCKVYNGSITLSNN